MCGRCSSHPGVAGCLAGVLVPLRPRPSPSDPRNCGSGFASGRSGTESGFETAAAAECHISCDQKVFMLFVVCFKDERRPRNVTSPMIRKFLCSVVVCFKDEVAPSLLTAHVSRPGVRTCL